MGRWANFRPPGAPGACSKQKNEQGAGRQAIDNADGLILNIIEHGLGSNSKPAEPGFPPFLGPHGDFEQIEQFERLPEIEMQTQPQSRPSPLRAI
jgi:hypothetical protein